MPQFARFRCQLLYSRLHLRPLAFSCGLALLIGTGWIHPPLVHADETPPPSTEAALDSVPDDPPSDRADELPSVQKSKPKRFDDLGQAVTDAAKKRHGIFILFTAAWCPWCKKELKVFDEPDVAAALDTWTVAVINVDDHPKVARQAGVESLPTVQVQTVDGRIIASQNGYLDSEELIAWLTEHREAILLSGDEFAGDDPPNEETRDRLLEQFQNRNPVAREAAIHRLLKHREQVAAAVAKRLETGPLQTRLTAWELLHEWKAPVETLDPWRPESLTPEALSALKSWVEQTDSSAKEDAPLAPEQVIELEEDISALLQTDDPAQERTIRERLARHGAKLLPVIYAQLTKAESQRAHDRLTLLRYRVVSPTALILRWPNGLERLTDAHVDERHAAVMELTQQVSSAEEGLLLELFSDPDPFVRELCLRALRSVGGSSAQMALLRLLKDPSPDVRAAVLGQLAESPSPQVVPQLSIYIEQEPDADLIVHAVRALRAVANESAVECLLTLFDHSGWHVRAEAVEAVGAILQTRRKSSAGELPRQAQILAAIKSRLSDDDSFVVSRSVNALKQAHLASAVDPMAEAASRKPELAVEIVQALSEMNSQNRSAANHLQTFAEHSDPRLRAAAMQGLLTINHRELPQQVQRGLSDPDRSVRIAAADTLFLLLNRDLPTGPKNGDVIDDDASDQTVTIDVDSGIIEETLVEEHPTGLLGSLFKTFLGGESPPLSRPIRRQAIEGQSASSPPDDGAQHDMEDRPADAADAIHQARLGEGPPGNDAELRAHTQRTDRPAWHAAATSALTSMLASADAEEKLAAAMPLVPLGQVDAAWPVLLQESQKNPGAARELSRILPWLTWDRRRELWDALLAHPAARQQIEKIGSAFVKIQDRRTEKYIWNLLAGADFPLAEFPAWQTLLHQLYGVEQHPNGNQQPAMSQRILTDWKSQAVAGTAVQQLMAACLLYTRQKSEAIEIARSLLERPSAAAALRGDALQIVLLGDSVAEAKQRTAALLSDDDQPWELRCVAIHYLATGARSLSYLRSTHLWIDTQAYYNFEFGNTPHRSPGDWGDPPTGVSPHDLRPFLSATDPEVARHAAFLAVWIHGDRLAWRQLLESWRQRTEHEADMHRLIYRAIATLEDETQTPILSQIYDQIHENHGEVKEFYWTIRSLTGPEILKLRKRIRDEVGMDQLRN